MVEIKHMEETDFNFDEPLTFDMVAEAVAARLFRSQWFQASLVARAERPARAAHRLSRRAVLRLRRMQRLHRDLGVNYAGAAIILDLVGRIEQLNRELAEMHKRFGD